MWECRMNKIYFSAINLEVYNLSSSIFVFFFYLNFEFANHDIDIPHVLP